MAVINIYIDQNGETKSTMVDESTIHKIGEEIDLNDNKYVILGIDSESHIDYATEIHINHVVPSNSIRRDNFGNI